MTKRPYEKRIVELKGLTFTWQCTKCGWANDNNLGPCRKCGHDSQDPGGAKKRQRAKEAE